MAVVQPTLSGLPGKSPLGAYIYVIRFNVGIIKVGLTSKPGAHRRAAEHGDHPGLTPDARKRPRR